MNYTTEQRDKLTRFAQLIANSGDDIENDVISATDEDDLMALLAHIDIMRRNLEQLKDSVRSVLES